MSARALLVTGVGLALGLAAVRPVRAAAQEGNPLPVPEETKTRSTSSTDVYDRESAFKKKFEDAQDKRHAAEQELERLRAKLSSDLPTAAEAAAKPPATPVPLHVEPAPVPPPPSAGAATARVRRGGRQSKAPPLLPAAVAQPEPYHGPLVFAVSAAAEEQVAETAIPLGSYVKARVLTGVEANTQDAYPVLLQLDYAFVGPNHTRIDLSHCFVIAKAKANLSTERVMGETQQLSCVRDDSEVVTRPAKGYLAGEDSTFGLTGQLISHQGRVLVAAVLATLAKGVGEAVSSAQTSTEVAAGNSAVASATNVTGSKGAYIAGKAVAEPATLIANWYLEYAKQLVPSIAVGSGRDVWIVLLDTVKVPRLSDDGGSDR